jgi:hypothetical protein
MGDWKSQYPLHASACEGTFSVAEQEIKAGADVVCRKFFRHFEIYHEPTFNLRESIL